MSEERGHEPVEPVPSFDWIDDECAGVKCGCGEQLTFSVGYPGRCPSCKRIFELHQETWMTEREVDDVNLCPYCGGVRHDDGSYCPDCTRGADGKTHNQHLAEIWRYWAEESVAAGDTEKAKHDLYWAGHYEELARKEAT